jgi:hypothetical protein
VVVADIGFTLDLSENKQWPMFVTVGGWSHREVESGLNQIVRCASVVRYGADIHVANVVLPYVGERRLVAGHRVFHMLTKSHERLRPRDGSDPRRPSQFVVAGLATTGSERCAAPAVLRGLHIGRGAQAVERSGVVSAQLGSPST